MNKLVRTGYLPGKSEYRSKIKTGTRIAFNNTSLFNLAKLAHANGEVEVLPEVVVVTPGSSGGDGISWSDWYQLQDRYGNGYRDGYRDGYGDGSDDASENDDESWWNSWGKCAAATLGGAGTGALGGCATGTAAGLGFLSIPGCGVGAIIGGVSGALTGAYLSC